MRMLIFGYGSLFVLLLCSSFVASVSGSPVKPEGKNDDNSVSVQDVNVMLSLLEAVSNGISSIPYIGSYFTPWIDTIVEIVDQIEINSNGALYRIFQQILPCILTVSGVECTGIAKNGGFSTILSNVISNVPDTFIPSFIKMSLLILLQYV